MHNDEQRKNIQAVHMNIHFNPKGYYRARLFVYSSFNLMRWLLVKSLPRFRMLFKIVHVLPQVHSCLYFECRFKAIARARILSTTTLPKYKVKLRAITLVFYELMGSHAYWLKSKQEAIYLDERFMNHDI